MLPWIIVAVWLIAVIAAGASGKVKVNDESLPPFIGAIVAPFIALMLGVALSVVSAVFTAPLWIWLLVR